MIPFLQILSEKYPNKAPLPYLAKTPQIYSLARLKYTKQTQNIPHKIMNKVRLEMKHNPNHFLCYTLLFSAFDMCHFFQSRNSFRSFAQHWRVNVLSGVALVFWSCSFDSQTEITTTDFEDQHPGILT
jgi:hypothetical protein